VNKERKTLFACVSKARLRTAPIMFCEIHNLSTVGYYEVVFSTEFHIDLSRDVEGRVEIEVIK